MASPDTDEVPDPKLKAAGATAGNDVPAVFCADPPKAKGPGIDTPNDPIVVPPAPNPDGAGALPEDDEETPKLKPGAVD